MAFLRTTTYKSNSGSTRAKDHLVTLLKKGELSSDLSKVEPDFSDLKEMSALPHKDGTAKPATTVLLENLVGCYDKQLKSQLAQHSNLPIQNPLDLTLNDHEKIATLAREFSNKDKADSPYRNTSRTAELFFEYLVLKHKLQSIQEHSYQVEDHHTALDLQAKIKSENDQFRTEVESHKAKINEVLQHPTPDKKPAFIKNSGFEQAVKYISESYLCAADLESKSRLKEADLKHFVHETYQNLDKMTSVGLQTESIQADKQHAERRLEAFCQKQSSSNRDSMRWELKYYALTLQYDYYPTPENKAAMDAYYQQRPSNCDWDPTLGLSIEAREAENDAREIAIANVKQQHCQQAQSFTDYAKYYDQLDNVCSSYYQEQGMDSEAVTSEQQESFRKFLILREAIQSSVSTEEKAIATETLDQFINRNPDGKQWKENFEKENIQSLLTPDVRQAVQAIAKLEANGQDKSTVLAHPQFRLARAALQYKQALQESMGVLDAVKNPVLNTLGALQFKATNDHGDFKASIKSIHQASDSYALLKKVSRPLEALRDRSRKLTFNYRMMPARLPMLDVKKYNLVGSPPVFLLEMNALTAEINELLDQRQAIEVQLMRYPDIANALKDSINKNTKAVDDKLHQLNQVVQFADRLDYFKIYSDNEHMESYLHKIRALYKNIDHTAYTRQFSVYPQAKYSHKAIENSEKSVEVTYLERAGYTNQWVQKRCEVDIKQKDGSSKIEPVCFKNKAEHDELFYRFCQENGLSGRNSMPVLWQSKNKIHIDWRHEELKKKWLEFVTKEYKKRREEEIKLETDSSASVHVDNPDDNTIVASPSESHSNTPSLG